MKVIHGTLSGLLAEVKDHAKLDGVRVAVLMQSMVGTDPAPRYASWIVVSAPLDWTRWTEWRLLVSRGRAEVNEQGCVVPARIVALTEERLAEVRRRVEAAGLAAREGIVAADGDSMDGILA